MAKNKCLAVLSLSAIAAMFAIPTTAMAQDGDIYKNDGTAYILGGRDAYFDNWSNLEDAVFNAENFKYEFSGKVYNLSEVANWVNGLEEAKDIDDSIAKNSVKAVGQDVNEFKGGEVKPPVVESSLKVESVSAINAKELKVTFNQPVDENTATNLDNYVISINNVKYKNGVNIVVNSVEKPFSQLLDGAISFDEDGNSVVFKIKDGYTTLNNLRQDTTDFNVLQNADKYSIDVKDGVLSADKSKQVARYTDTQKTFADTNAPKLLSIEKTSDNKLSLTFDEPLTDTTRLMENPLKVTIDGEVIALDVNAGAAGSTIKGTYETNGHFTVVTKDELTTEQLKVGKHDVSVYNATDVAMPNHNVEKILTSSYVIEKDTVAPTVKEIKQAKNNDREFVIIFSEPIKTFSNEKLVIKKGNYTFEKTADGVANANGSTTYKVQHNANSDKVVVIFGADAANNAINTLYDNNKNSVNLSVEIAGYKDLVDLEGSKYQGAVILNKDLIAPKVTSKFDNEIKGITDGKLDTLGVNDGKVIVKFDKNLKANANLEKANIVVTDKDGIIRTVTKAESKVNNDENIVEIQLTDLVDRDNIEAKAPFTVKFMANTVKTAVNEVGNAELTTIVLPSNNIGDPVVEAVNSAIPNNNNVVTVTYEEAMAASAANLANYTLDKVAFPQGTTISMTGDNKKVIITLPEGYTNKTINKMLTISKNVKTAKGSTVVASVATKAPYTEILTFKDNTKPVLTEAKYLVDDIKTAESSNKIKLVFNEDLKAITKDDQNVINDLELSIKGTKQTIVGIENSTSDKKVLIVTLKKDANLEQSATISIVPEGKDNQAINITDNSENSNKAKVVTITTIGKEIDIDEAKKKAVEDAKPIGVVLAETEETTKGVAVDAGANQVSTIKVTAGAVNNSGNITVAGKTVAVLKDDDASSVAKKIKTELDKDKSVWNVTVEKDTLTFTAADKVVNVNAIQVADTDTTGVSFKAQQDTTKGKVPVNAPVKEVGTTTVTAGSTKDGTIKVKVADGTLNQIVEVKVNKNDDANTVADKVRKALVADNNVKTAYMVTGDNANIVLTQNGAGSNVELKVTLQA